MAIEFDFEEARKTVEWMRDRLNELEVDNKRLIKQIDLDRAAIDSGYRVRQKQSEALAAAEAALEQIIDPWEEVHSQSEPSGVGIVVGHAWFPKAHAALAQIRELESK